MSSPRREGGTCVDVAYLQGRRLQVARRFWAAMGEGGYPPETAPAAARCVRVGEAPPGAAALPPPARARQASKAERVK